jgi:hypothetical protein
LTLNNPILHGLCSFHCRLLFVSGMFLNI